MSTITAPPLTSGVCATLACLWEATAAKPGNVYRAADFEDVTYADFLTSSAAIAPAMDAAATIGVGPAVLQAVAATRAAVATNTNLGTVLLLAPLAAIPLTRSQSLAEGLPTILEGLTQQDASDAFAAIRLAQPGGLGSAERADVNDPHLPPVTLLSAMQLAAPRDLVARQYANGFMDVFAVADRIEEFAAAKLPLGEVIVRSYLHLIAEHGDTLVERKCGAAASQEIARRARRVLDALQRQGEEVYRDATADFDFWLRADGHRRNPGASADVVAAALFVLLREGRIVWPIEFY